MNPLNRRGILLFLLPAVAWAQPAAQRSSCETCHSKAAAQHQGSAHQAAGITCIDCHGGDPRDMNESAMSPAAGYKGKPTRAEQPQFCASCHANGTMMRPFGLPTNQLEEYMTSRHGKAVAAGRTQAAVCSDCHTAHGVLSPKDPRSTVNPEHVPDTCGQCHSNDALMRSFGVPTGQVAAYKASVHGQSLLLGKNDAAPSCATCHGSHGAAPPALSSVHHVCARCHPNTAEQFEAGAHGQAAAAGRMTPCVSCHSAHSIRHPTDEDLLAFCGNCHRGDPQVSGVSQALHDEIQMARQQFAAAEQQMKEAHPGDVPQEELEAEVGDAKTALLQTAVAQHSLRPRDVERHTTVVKALYDDLQAAAEQSRDQKRVRKLALLYLWGYLGLTVGAIWIKRQRSLAIWLREHDSAAGTTT